MKPIYPIIFWLSITAVLISVVCLFIFGLKFGTDFLGGAVIEIEFKNGRPSLEQITTITERAGIDQPNITPIGERVALMRFAEISEETHTKLKIELEKAFGSIIENRFDSVGPVIGKELKTKSITAIIVLLIAIAIYIAIVFRKLSIVLSPWILGAAAIIALLHDILIPMGIFALLGHYHGIEITAVFVAAALTILGFSVSDTVVVFDRVRENVLRFGRNESFPNLVHKSIMQTLTRSLNTSMTALLSLFAVYFFGGDSIKYFALALIVGIALGAYSSIFVASPLIMWFSKKHN